jgi:uncharacterized protein (UPF0371 family)
MWRTIDWLQNMIKLVSALKTIYLDSGSKWIGAFENKEMHPVFRTKLGSRRMFTIKPYPIVGILQVRDDVVSYHDCIIEKYFQTGNL